MKKFILSLLLTFIYVSNSFASSEQYAKAIQLYNDKKYKESQVIFRQLILIQDSKRINFYLGRTSYELGDYKDALNYYEKVLKEEPENLRVRLEIAQTYLYLGKKEDAKSLFSYLLEQNIPDNIKGYIKAILTNLNSNKDYKLNNMLLIGLGYDDNAKSTTDVGSYSFYDLNSQIQTGTSEEKISSATYEVGLVSEYTKKLQEDLLFKLNLVGLSQNYFKNKLSDKELDLLSLGITPIFLNKDYKISLKLGYDFIWYGHKSYLRNFTVAPEISFQLDEKLINNTRFRFLRKSFIQSANNSSGVIVNDTQKDSRTYELLNKLSHYSKKLGLTSFELTLGKESDLDNIRVDVDKKYGSLTLSHVYPLSQKVIINPIINYKKTKYDNYDPNFKTYREDDRYRFTLGLNYNYTKSVVLSGSYIYLKQNSNFTPYDYDKNLVKLNVNYKF